MREMQKKRISRLAQKMQEMNVDVAVFVDDEDSRSKDVRYFTGHPSDAILLVGSNAHTVLLPWDVNMAKERAFADRIIPYTDYHCRKIEALKDVLCKGARAMGIAQKALAVELPPSTAHTDYLKLCEVLLGYNVIVREDGIHAAVMMMRMIKDSYEMECIRSACKVGDIIIDKIEENIKCGKIRTEEDVALLIEREARENGCERTGFDTLAAGPARSFAIHAFPGYTSGAWPGGGKKGEQGASHTCRIQGTLSILDFGVVYEGYTSDTTLTVAAGELSKKQEMMLDMVTKAAKECAPLYRPGVPIKDAALKADEIFNTARMKMPHSLGHAIGLDIHELPRVSVNTPVRESNGLLQGAMDASDGFFHEGMVLTLEPGLYDAECGGVRLENDILITKNGPEVLTHSRIIRV